ncbi:MAG: hypothetical protein K5866_06315 [Treponema sp.]|nr:hypothetical protein [Treponema sp.]
MKLQSIYAHMQEGALKVPQDQNCKIVFRHSIREKIDSGVGKTVSLTNEGIELCKTFGKGLEYDIGFVASSSCLRNIQSCEYILMGANKGRNIILAPNALEGPQTQESTLSYKVFEEYNYNNREIIFKLKNEGLPGFNSIETAAGIMLDFIFSNGNEKKKVDLFCTHDFQMAILYAYLFDFAKTKKSLEDNKWPMMMEGMIFWGNRNHFYCSWRGQNKEFSQN